MTGEQLITLWRTHTRADEAISWAQYCGLATVNGRPSRDYYFTDCAESAERLPDQFSAWMVRERLLGKWPK